MYNYEADKVIDAITEARDLFSTLEDETLIEAAFGSEISSAMRALEDAESEVEWLDDRINELEGEVESAEENSNREDITEDLMDVLNNLEHEYHQAREQIEGLLDR
jgi:predicted  nucleic acid-binding Zn-ribbon protein